jgi:hypothetical protein
VNTRAVVGVGWCTWSPSAVGDPMVCTGTQLGVTGPYFFEEEGVTVTVNSERYVAMLRPEWKGIGGVWFQQDGAAAHTA